MLRKMLYHLDCWVQAQKYWLTLDPIYNSGMFADVFGSETREFIETRTQFRRIMWSSFRNRKVAYNLLISDRIAVYKRLTEFYLRLQQKSHEYLEQKRTVFTRFFFLNDSQFLDMLMLVNSNQDFSVYVNLLFQGAYNLFMTRFQTSQHVHLLARKDSFGVHVAPADSDDDISMSSEDDFDLEGQLEAYIK